MKLLAITLLSLMVGCATHCHSVEITSNPTAQKFRVTAEDKDGKSIWPVNLAPNPLLSEPKESRPPIPEKLTPYEVTFPGDVWRATIVVEFDDGSTQEKQVAFPHALTHTTLYDPVIGLPLGSVRSETVGGDRKIHFDVQPKRPGCGCGSCESKK